MKYSIARKDKDDPGSEGANSVCGQNALFPIRKFKNHGCIFDK